MKYHFLIPYVDQTENNLLYEENLRAIQSILDLRVINKSIIISIVVNDTIINDKLNISKQFTRISSSLNYFSENSKKYLSPLMFIGKLVKENSSFQDNIFIVINSDICISKNIFDFLNSIYVDNTVHVVNRRTVPYTSAPNGSVEVGVKHGGYDFFVFSAICLKNIKLCPKFYIGGNHYGKCMILFFSFLKQEVIIHKDLAISYHYGDEKSWKKDKRKVSSINKSWFVEKLNEDYIRYNVKLLNYLKADLLYSPFRQVYKLLNIILNK